MVSMYNLGVNSQVQKKTKFAFLAHQATCIKWEEYRLYFSYPKERGPHHKVRSTTKWSQRAETSQVEHKCVH